MEEARKRGLRLQQQRDEMVDNHLNLAKLGMNVAAKKLYDIIRDEDTLPSGVLPQLLTASTTLHRLTLGEATERIEASEVDPEQSELDWSVLTDEELAVMDDAYRKLYPNRYYANSKGGGRRDNGR